MDAIDAYLDELARRLRLTPTAARRFLAEAEAHLNDLVDEAVASGTDRTTAEAHAIARFGSSRDVARSANGGPLGIFRAAGLATAQLGAAGFAAVIAGTAVAEVLARITSTAWVFGPPRAWTPTSGQMSHWLRIHPGAGDWRSAAALENAADSLVLRAGLAVVGLAVCLAVFLLLRRFSPLGGGVVPAVGLTAFTGAAVVLVSASAAGLPWIDWGRGQSLCDAGVALAAALLCLPRCLRGALVDV